MPAWKLATAASAVALVACVSYSPGSLRYAAPDGALVAEGRCLDVAAAVTDDAVATWPVVDVRFGNRCDGAVSIDLAALAVVGRTRGGAIVSLVPHDPRGELRPLPLEARWRGGERLQYRDARDLGVVGDEVVEVCVDLTRLAGTSAPVASCFPRPHRDTVAAVTP